MLKCLELYPIKQVTESCNEVGSGDPYEHFYSPSLCVVFATERDKAKLAGEPEAQNLHSTGTSEAEELGFALWHEAVQEHSTQPLHLRTQELNGGHVRTPGEKRTEEETERGKSSKPGGDATGEVEEADKQEGEKTTVIAPERIGKSEFYAGTTAQDKNASISRHALLQVGYLQITIVMRNAYRVAQPHEN
ncbi:hypothetical protein NDU88_007746 [Pleurodeles waltl]|uniref:Uncharacterized protein n=1 Tax=Pleurodeles waltl TaxID=8319 RepID=A0AAV7QMR3_PLEWA|nr:hypothetical protein NDU88_007746 [Pleurodeles waltl]